ncbi:helix-turn-helix domain-containing protein [Methylobacterium aquaticum]|uniref:helix-turn-helix domain-containing protein n=1 Tax=Methylobacterium aquaticum TaxID=270351 RepID=UPI003D178F6C
MVEHGSFSAAADALRLSNGAASKAVSRLEKRLGVIPFHRTTRTLTLSPRSGVRWQAGPRRFSAMRKRRRTRRATRVRSRMAL